MYFGLGGLHVPRLSRLLSLVMMSPWRDSLSRISKASDVNSPEVEKVKRYD